MVRTHVGLADGLAHRIKTDPRFELVAPHPFALVCFRCVDGDESTDSLAKAVNATGDAYWTASVLDGRSIIRVSIGQTRTEQRHVDQLWDLIDTLG